MTAEAQITNFAERRAHVRLPLELSARYARPGGKPAPCVIRDYCPGGLFLDIPGEDGDFITLDGRQLVRGDPITIQFDARANGSATTFQLRADVARVLGGGVGTSFQHVGPDALKALHDSAAKRRSRKAGETKAPELSSRARGEHVPSQEIYESCRGVLERHLDVWARDLFTTAREQLLNAARDAKSNVAQTECFDAVNELERIEPSVESDFRQAALHQLDDLWSRERPTPASDFMDGAELSLVDTGSFDDWLAVKALIARWGSPYEDAEYEIERRLSVVVARSVDQENQPFGVNCICFAFHEAVQNLGAAKRTRATVFEAFEEVVVKKLGELHDEVNDVLVEGGVLPDLERPKYGVPSSGAASTGSAGTPTDSTAGAGRELSPLERMAALEMGAGQVGPAVAVGPGAAPGPVMQIPAAGVAAPPAAGGLVPGPAAWNGAGAVPAPTGHPGLAGEPAPAGYAVPGAGPASAAYAAGAHPAPAGFARPAGVPGLPGVPGQGPGPAYGAGGGHPGGPGGWTGPGGSVQPGIPADAGQGAPYGFAYAQPAFGQAVATARTLMGLQRHVGSAVQGEPLGPTAPAPEVTEAIIGSPEVLQGLAAVQASGTAEHWASTGPLALSDLLKSRLETSGVPCTAVESDAIDVVSGLMDAMLGDPLVNRHVKSRLRRLAMPLVRASLLDEGLLRDDTHAARQLVDCLGRLDLPEDSVNENVDCMRRNVDPLVETVVKRHETDPMVFAQVLSALEVVLERQHARYNENIERLVLAREAQQAIVSSLRGGEPEEDLHSTQQTAVIVDDDATAAVGWNRCLELAAKLELGAVFTLDAGAPSARRASLAWVDDKRNSFIFVDGAGEKTASLTRQEIALGLHRGTLTPASADDIPLTERGIYQVLQGLHEKVRHESSHDPLTGLLNEKQFRIRLDLAYEKAVEEGACHVVCALRLDGAQAIQEQCGERAMNALLAKIARVVEKHVGDTGEVGRIDDDLFAVLFSDCTPDEAVHLVERQRRSIEQSRCVYHGQQFELTLSIGLGRLTEDSDSAEAALDIARRACAQAVGTGGNRTQVDDDEADLETTQRLIVAPTQSEPSIIDLMQAGQLALRCQRVQPISESAGTKPFFEILLGVRADGGELESAGRYIAAAEREGEMLAIDRWVVRESLGWMSDNRRVLGQVGGLAINLSGNSLGDSALLAYVLEEFNNSMVPPAKVVFEITESAAIDELSVALDFIRTLREYGCRFSLDDFGAGHASFSYLKNLPVDKVKIDGQFVKDMVDSPGDHAMVRSINEIAHLLGKQTVAEYAESDVIIGQLKDLGVDFVQGYAVHMPVPIIGLQP